VFLWHGGPPGAGNLTGLGAAGDEATLDWAAESNLGASFFGATVASAGDVNGDGYDDVIVGAPEYGDAPADEGWVFVWHGGAGGLGTDGTPANADWSAQSDLAAAWLGSAVAGAGDVNSDGYDDVLVGAFQIDTAYCWLGGPSGLGASGTPLNADWSAGNGGSGDRYFAYSVAGAGDVNGDGYADVLIGAPDEPPVGNSGAAYLWLGGPSDLGSNGTTANADWTKTGAIDQNFGRAVAPAGDVNGDGFGDVLVSEYLS
jgi:hypothetical protein